MRFKTVDAKGNGRTHFILECSEASIPIPFEDTIDVGSAFQVEQSLMRAFNGWGIQFEAAHVLEFTAGIRKIEAALKINGKADGPIPVSIRADSVHPRPIRWLTQQFPLAKYSTIIGHPGLGKSLLTTDLAAQCLHRGPGARFG